MEFRDSYRMEAIYFQTLKDEINRVKSLMASGDTEQAKTLLENAVNVDGAVLLLYRNLGELWGELGAKIEEVKKELEKLDSRVSDNLRELNEKIDDVNNTIIRLIRALEERVKALEDCCEEVQEDLNKKQDKLLVHFTPTGEDNYYEADKTFPEMYKAINEGSDVVGYVYADQSEEVSFEKPIFVARIKSHYLEINDHLEDEEEPYYSEEGGMTFYCEYIPETILPRANKECIILISYSKYMTPDDSESYEEQEISGLITYDSRNYAIHYSGSIANISFTNEQLDRIFNSFSDYPVTITVNHMSATLGVADCRVYHSAYTYRTASTATFVHYCFTCQDFTSGSLVTHVLEIIQNMSTREVTYSVFDA